jgi:CBS domain containing-hemolysin-like protein
VSPLAFIGALTACLACEAFFAASEIALVACDEIKVKAESERGDKRAKRLAALLQRRDQVLALTLTAANLATITAATLTTAYLHYVDSRRVFLAPFLLAPLVLLCGEALPKYLTLRRPLKFAKLGASVLHPLLLALMPLVWLETSLSRALRRLAGVSPEARSVFLSREDLTRLLERESHARKAAGDAISPAERNMIRRLFRFSRLEARQAMVPLVRVEAVSQETSLAEAIEVVRREGFSRLAVFERQIVNLVGVIHVFDLLEASDLSLPVRAVMRPVSYVSESSPLSEILSLLQRTGDNLAAVVDEHGGASGIITMEDLLEEIVGEIEDEYDVREENIRVLNSRQIAVAGRAQISELNERFGLRLPESDDYTTIAGLVIERLGRIPQAGEQLQLAGLTINVALSDARAVQELVLNLSQPLRAEHARRP